MTEPATPRRDAVKAHEQEAAARPIVASIGTGRMGSHLARRLAQAGLSVRAWNRTAGKAEPLSTFGVRLTSSPGAAAEDADVIICMLSDAGAVEDVLFGSGRLVDSLRPGTTVVDMSSIDPVAARDHAVRLAAIDVDHLDAPVSGGTSGAAAGTLAIMVGGERAVFDRAAAVLACLGSPRYVGASGSGQLAKLTNQIIVAIGICAIAEGIVFAQRAGADPAAVIASIRGGFAESRVLDEHGTRMLEGAFEPGGSVRLFLKDLRGALAVARREGLHLPASELVTDLFERLAEHDGADLDHSAMLLEIERLNGPDTSGETT